MQGQLMKAQRSEWMALKLYKKEWQERTCCAESDQESLLCPQESCRCPSEANAPSLSLFAIDAGCTHSYIQDVTFANHFRTSPFIGLQRGVKSPIFWGFGTRIINIPQAKNLKGENVKIRNLHRDWLILNEIRTAV